METQSNLRFWPSVLYLPFWASFPIPCYLSCQDTCLATRIENSSKSWTSQVRPGTSSCSPASSSDSPCRSCSHWFSCHDRDQTLSGSMPSIDISELYCCFKLDRVVGQKWAHPHLLKILLNVALRILRGSRNLTRLSEHCSVSFSRLIFYDLSEVLKYFMDEYLENFGINLDLELLSKWAMKASSF
jgi:hypothetical protein